MTARSPSPWLAAPTRLAGLSPARARAVLTLVLVALGLWLAMPDIGRRLAPPPPAAPPPRIDNPATDGDSDLELYQRIADDVARGEDYYAATARELRARAGYPLRPFFTFRLPTLAYLGAKLTPAGMLTVQWALAGLTAFAWLRRLAPALSRTVPRVVVVLLLAGGLAVSVQPTLTTSHELWAGLLVALSLALWRPGRWRGAVAVALAAMLFRELAAAFAIAMAALAWRDGGHREAAGWGAALIIFGLAVAAHARAVARVVTPHDLVSDGWLGLHGTRFFTVTLQHATVLEAFPAWLTAPLVPLALLGWSAWRDPLGVRVAATVGAFGLLIAGFARYDNFYWGLIAAPVLLVGLVFVPDAIRDLGAAVGGRAPGPRGAR